MPVFNRQLDSYGQTMIIAVMNPKGGSTRTTSAIYITTALARAGSRVHLLDMSEFNESLEWAYLSASSLDALPFPVTVATPDTIDREVETVHADFVVLDTGSRDWTSIVKAVEVADIVIAPVRPSAGDVRTLLSFRDTLANKPWYAFLTAVDGRTNSTHEIREFLRDNGIPLLNTAIPLAVEIQAMFGRCPKSLCFYGDLTLEFLLTEKRDGRPNKKSAFASKTRTRLESGA